MADGDITGGSTSGTVKGWVSAADDFVSIFRGKTNTTSVNNKKTLNTTTKETEDVSQEKALALLQQLLGSTTGLAAVSQGEKNNGLYNSTVNEQLTNDLLSNVAGKVAALSSTKTIENTGTIDENNTNSEHKKGALEWVICTELNKQGRLSDSLYRRGAPVFISTPVRVKAGYYIWAIPAVLHLRAHPQSLYSRVLESVMVARARQIAGDTSLYGYVVLKGLYAICWTLSRTIARKPIDFSVLYTTKF